MSTITKEVYLKNPCRAASLPYWKAQAVAVPENMRVLHADEFSADLLVQYQDVRYFKLLHDLLAVQPVAMPKGYALRKATPAELAVHICSCYASCNVTETEVLRWQQRKTYAADLLLTVCEAESGQIVASGIAELDREIGEGVLEWIQVSQEHRRRGLGQYIVLELLRRMQEKARFVTVSGQCDDIGHPEKLYRACGFTGDDVWHVLRERE